MVVTFATGNPAIIAEVVAQVAAIVEHNSPAYVVDSPLNIQEEAQFASKKARGHRHAMDKLVLGLGGDHTAKPVEFAGQHIRSFQMLTSEGKKIRALDPDSMSPDAMRRAHQVTAVIQ